VVSATAVEIAVVAGADVSDTAVGEGDVAGVFTGVPVGEGTAVPVVLSATAVPIVTGTVVTDVVTATVLVRVERDVSFAVTTGVVASAIDTALAETGTITNNTRNRTGSTSFKESLWIIWDSSTYKDMRIMVSGSAR